MKDAKGNKVEIGTLLYANLGEYGPCARICDLKKDPFNMGYDCAYLEWVSETTDELGNKTFIPNSARYPISLENSYWSATRTWWQKIKQPIRTWWYSFRHELKELKQTIKALYGRN